jgi:modification methylase
MPTARTPTAKGTVRMTDHTHAASHRLHSRSRALSGERDVTPADEVVGTVWTTGQASLATQLRQRGYCPGTHRTDPTGMSPAIAAHAIAAFTRPADLVLDPDCGAGTTLVEALHAGCHTIGLAGTHRTWEQARANVSAAKAAGAAVDGMVLVLGRRPNTLVTARAAGFTGRVNLILTTLRLPAGARGPHALGSALSRLQVLLADSRALLHSDGHVVITTAPYRDPDQPTELLDVPARIMAATSAVGLVPLARCVALTGALYRDHVRPWKGASGRPAAYAHLQSRSHQRH